MNTEYHKVTVLFFIAVCLLCAFTSVVEATYLAPDSVNATTLGTTSGRGPERLYDRSLDYVWPDNSNWESIYTDGTENHCWMEYQWNSPVIVQESKIYNRINPYPHTNPIDHYMIKYWDDATSQYVTYADITNTDSSKAIFTDTLGDIQTTKLRVDFIRIHDEDTNNYDVASIIEWEVYGTPTPEPATLLLLGLGGLMLRKRKR